MDKVGQKIGHKKRKGKTEEEKARGKDKTPIQR
jgi:hypothetical protein